LTAAPRFFFGFMCPRAHAQNLTTQEWQASVRAP
jgi:hypothetical protein